jgi:hypothetical protein
LIALTGKLPSSTSICSRTISGLRGKIFETTPGVSATTQVTAVNPYTPSALKVFKSAWMPAPALLSDPAMVRATGILADISIRRPQGDGYI